MECTSVMKMGVAYMGGVQVSLSLKEELAWATVKHLPIISNLQQLYH